MNRMLAIAFMTAFVVTACEEKECPPVVQEEPCDFADRVVVAALGTQHPVALDMDGDGWITPLDRGKWEAECQ